MKTRLLCQYSLIVLMLCCLTGCVNEQEDYISKYCPGSCTEVSGKVLRASGQPVKGMQLTATWRNMRTFYEGMGGTTRKKAVAYTDAQGNYTLRFLLRDDEMEDGYIDVSPQIANCPDWECYSYTLYWDKLKRDTTYTYDLVLP
jgi:hypothetical protein